MSKAAMLLLFLVVLTKHTTGKVTKLVSILRGPAIFLLALGNYAPGQVAKAIAALLLLFGLV